MAIPAIRKKPRGDILKALSGKDILICLLFVVGPVLLLLLPVLALSKNTLAGMGYFLLSFTVLLLWRKWKLFSLFSVLTSVILLMIFFFPQVFWENIILLTGRSVPESWNPPFMDITPLDSYKFAIAIIFPFIILFLVFLFYLITGFSLYNKNKASLITKLFLSSFVSFGLGQGLYFYWFFRDSSYTIFRFLLPHLLPSLILFLLHYSFTFLGLLLLWSACSSRINVFRSKAVLSSTLFFLCSLGLVLTVGVAAYYLIVDLPEIFISLEFELIFVICYVLSFVIFPCSAFFQLRFLPDWFTPIRRRWVTRIRIGIVFLIIYGIFQAIKSFQGLNPWFRLMLLIITIALQCLTIVIVYSGLPEVTEWFFDEIKIRAAPEMKGLEPGVSLEHLWQLVDTWQDKEVVPTDRMTETDVIFYVQEALNALRTSHEG
ncbi:MAG: hypothetical protein ACFFBQ_01460 [Promethearchaeota archaeon]